MAEIYVLGKTTPKEIYIITQDRAFMQSEYMIIEDEKHGNLVGEIVETNYYPMVVNSILPPGCVIEFVANLGFETIKATAIAKVKILDELQSPVTPSSRVRNPEYDEIKHLLINAQLPEGMLLGVIKGTDDVQDSLPSDLQDIVPLWVDKKIVPQSGVPFIINHHKLREYPGIGFFGGSGSGKTVALRSYCEEIMEIKAPGLAFDPHFELDFKEPNEGISESQIRDYQDRYEIFQVGENVGINFSELTVTELIDLLEFSKELSEPMKSALESVYEKGDTYTNLFNKIGKLRMAFENESRPQHMKQEIPQDAKMLFEKHKNNIAGASTLQGLSWRLSGLYKTGIFNKDISLVEKAIKNCKLAIIRSPKYKALRMISSYLISKLYKKRRDYQDFDQKLDSKDRPDYFPMFFIIMDEAHNFAPNGNISTPTKRVLREIAQEARKYGVFEVFATQRPSLLDTTIVAQLNTKFIFRTNIKQDMDMIKVETNLTDEEFKRLPELSSGNCFVASATLRKTYYVKFRTTRTKSPHQADPFEQLKEYRSKIEASSLDNILIKFLPIKSDKINNIHADINREYGSHVAIDEITNTLERMSFKDILSKKKTPFGSIYSLNQ